jgi:tRNA pseudouridine55 synthase
LADSLLAARLSQEYRTTAILGCSTDSFDSMGAVDATAAWEHITPTMIEGVLDRFRGEIMQMPPMCVAAEPGVGAAAHALTTRLLLSPLHSYSALKMDGKPLYEYARLGLPLPRPVEARKVTVHELVLESFQPSRSADQAKGHDFQWPTKRLDDEEKEQAEKTRRLVEAAAQASGETSIASELDPAPAASTSTSAAAGPSTDAAACQSTITPPVFTLRMTVSSGTYVRSIVNDVARALSTLATVVVLTRTRQGEFSAEAGNVVPWESVREAADEEERRFLAARPAKIAEKTRKREEAKAKQKEKTRLEREAKRRALEGVEEEEAINAVEGSAQAPATTQAAPVPEPAAPEAAADIATPPPPGETKPPRRTMDELVDWEKEILAKFEEHLE